MSRKKKQIEPEVKGVSVAFEITANLGNYESAKCRIGLDALVREGETVEEVHDALMSKVPSLFGKQADYFGEVAEKILREDK
jgi:hypothetical protein